MGESGIPARWRRPAGIAAVLLLAYLASFGPAVYGLSLWARHDPSRAGRYLGPPFTILYLPHLQAMRWSYAYYRYGMWWAGLPYGDYPVTERDWGDFRTRPLRP